ncbi:hypothetical protein KC717_04535 [Candidatus Dojkabacteria bacterium]|uniref:Uncharacterized protein n=1 Tax=Candidatus Dojkabacteria bacterium TaxID=2099670 RepID=A0A955RKL1_9BACT|nr:hypothetical protein [Candidatus Dojkabacteria bacterium]
MEKQITKQELHELLQGAGFITFETDIDDGFETPNFYFTSQTTNQTLDSFLTELGLTSKVEVETEIEWCEWCGDDGVYLVGYNNEQRESFYYIRQK